MATMGTKRRPSVRHPPGKGSLWVCRHTVFVVLVIGRLGDRFVVFYMSAEPVRRQSSVGDSVPSEPPVRRSVRLGRERRRCTKSPSSAKLLSSTPFAARPRVVSAPRVNECVGQYCLVASVNAITRARGWGPSERTPVPTHGNIVQCRAVAVR